MGDHFVLLVDRLLTEATLEAAIESQNRKEKLSFVVDNMEIDLSSPNMKFGKEPSLRKMVECRICQDEDEESNMESPCSCCGSLKYAHRRCVQKWCNEKGDTVCEICHQQFKPGYTAPPRLFQIGRIPMNFRGNWEISRQDITNPHFVAMLSTDNDFVESDHEEYSASSGGGLLCCRSVAFIFMILLILRHILPFMFSQSYEYSLPLFLLMLLRTVGILLPIYVILRAAASIHRIRHLDCLGSPMSTDNESMQMQTQTQTHIIHLQ